MVNPTGYTALDLIGFTDKGTYSSSDNYVKNDLVHYSGNIWRCLIDDTSGIAPAEGVNWTLFIGEPTNLVERIIAPVETDPATNAWAVGRQIIYNDNLYEVIVAITAGDALVTYEDDPTNANIKLAPPVEAQVTAISDEIADMNNVLGAKNLLQNNATSQTINGVTCTVNTDKTISTNGVYTGSDDILLRINTNFTVPQSGEYILTGTPFTQQEWTFLLYMTDNSSGSIIAIDFGQGVNYSLDSSKTYSVVLWCKQNFDTSGYNIKPMIRPASIEDDTYVPFAKTNQQLTKGIVSIYKQDIQPTKDSVSGVCYVAKSAVTGKEGVIGFWLQDNNDLIITRMWENDYNYYFFIRECNSSFTPYTGTAPTITVSTYD